MGDYAGAEQQLCDLWVLSQLKLVSKDLETVAAGLASRVYLDFAPKTAKYPFIIYQCQTPPRDIRGVGVFRVMVDTLYVVKAVAQTNDYGDLAPIASIIDRAMTTSVGGTVSDGFIFSAVRDEGFSLVEVESGTQYRHLGGQYKLQAQG